MCLAREQVRFIGGQLTRVFEFPLLDAPKVRFRAALRRTSPSPIVDPIVERRDPAALSIGSVNRALAALEMLRSPASKVPRNFKSEVASLTRFIYSSLALGATLRRSISEHSCRFLSCSTRIIIYFRDDPMGSNENLC